MTSRNVRDGQPRVAEELGGAAGADQLDVEFVDQRGGEFCRPVLSETEMQCAADGNEVGHRLPFD